jgi:hypothetical protein
MKTTASSLALVLCVAAVAACSASTPSADPTGPTGPTGPAGSAIVVTLSPLSASTSTGGSVAFTASVTGTADTGVTWSVQEGATGGTVSASGVYQAPAAAGTYHVVATSHADASKFQVAAVLVTLPTGPGVAVSVTPSSATLDACGATTFSATVTGSTNQNVTWSVKEGAAGGTITSAGAYGASSAAGTYHVVATSQADGTRTGEAAVTVGPEKVLAVSVLPGSGTVSTNGTLAFSATVTTSCGTFAAQ